uniref:Uncharacterized protein n=1 Tax=Candidatus Methanogaster sp. ANME-2c ERB4 TaxID=2759911 RepID=A0A7G9YFF0_9EURY|nr:hypothetical protein EIOBDEGA_00022 [Methanosarcinales archaeon ANME-2c ERB4]
MNDSFVIHFGFFIVSSLTFYCVKSIELILARRTSLTHKLFTKI